ncbi:hypothetical protein H9Y04_21205 [Streptomyces sp. TRM66268-LWL]|uniref:Uncharacterized protein n=1 Tax=Streptomyces polyasparticus TaxID=2767826 RepID=A0ABR7SL47_9ACTN|nr:hypothetical protein [Streptomyces polyasparticus]MBC9715073.1 hypothetical protein [Streptomyces polyasparticus]
MSERRYEVRCAARQVSALFVLRCAALLAVVLWALPLCAHPAHALREAAAAESVSMSVSVSGSMPGSAVDPSTSVPALGHVCPDLEHGGGDAHCRASAGALATTATPVPSAAAHDAVALPAGEALLVHPVRGSPGADAPTPGIHQLQVQRI